MNSSSSSSDPPLFPLSDSSPLSSPLHFNSTFFIASKHKPIHGINRKRKGRSHFCCPPPMAKQSTPEQCNSFSPRDHNNRNTNTNDENSESVESPHPQSTNKVAIPIPNPNPDENNETPHDRGCNGGASNNDIDHHDEDTDKLVGDEQEEKADPEISFGQLSEDVDRFITTISTGDHEPRSLEIPQAIEKFLYHVESKVKDYDDSCTGKFGEDHQEDSSFLNAIHRVSRLIDKLSQFTKESHTLPLLNQLSMVLHRGMLLVEDELRSLLDESKQDGPSGTNDQGSKNSSDSSDSSKTGKGRQQVSIQNHHDLDYCELPDQSDSEQTEGVFPTYSPEAMSTIGLLSKAMLSAGYEAECVNLFIITRRHAFQEALKRQGFEKISIDDVQRMSWETLEGTVTTWIRVLKHCSSCIFPGEHKFYQSVFGDENTAASKTLLSGISRAIILQAVNFAEAVAMTKRVPEKLFKFLNMYKALRDLGSATLHDESLYTEDGLRDMRSELSVAMTRLGEAAVSVFCELENLIKNDNARTPVPSGAVHPLTRYTMNYLELACDYKDTLEEVFQRHQKTTDQTQDHDPSSENKTTTTNQNGLQVKERSSFASEVATIMDLLDAYLDAKSKLYKDPALRFISLMNNGRYMLQKIKKATEVRQVIGDPWVKKRSSDMRHYHKGYQRESWSRALQCLNPEGLQVNGKVNKPILKERFKSFNQLFDEIHKTQSAWVVSDEQLRSELRVSVSAVMIPAYRSFLARFGQQYFTPGRQYEKYIKYQPEDIESTIDELFDGNPVSSAAIRRKT